MGNNCLWLSSVCGVPSLGPSTFYYLSILGVPGTKACDNLKERKRHVVAQSHSLTLCDPMDCSMPGFPVHHLLPEFTQTHVH